MRDSNDVYVDDVFDKLKQFIKRILRLFIRFLKLIWSKKIIFLVLLLVGFITGYIIDRNTPTKYETVLQVRTLPSSTEYIYNLVNNFNKNLSDSLYLEENNLDYNEFQAVEIDPLANMEDLISSFSGENSQTLETLILNTSTQDLLTSEFFRSQYSHHEVSLKFGESYSKQSIEKFINLLNNNTYYQDLFKLRQSSYELQIQQNQLTVTKIDTLVSNYNKSIDTGAAASASINALINEQRATSVYDLLRFRTELIRDIENLKENLKELKSPVTLTNRPVIIAQEGLIEKKLFFIPFVFISAFIFILFLKGFFRKMKFWVEKD